MRFRPWFSAGLALFVSVTAQAAGPRLRHQSTWMFGHRCGVTFGAAGPTAFLVPNEAFAVEGFSAMWNDPRTGATDLYGDGKHVWRGRDHALLYEDAAADLSPLQAAAMVPVPPRYGRIAVVSSSNSAEGQGNLARVTRLSPEAEPANVTSFLLPPGVIEPSTVQLAVLTDFNAVAAYWTSRTDPRQENVLAGSISEFVALPDGFFFGPPGTPVPDGATASMSFDGVRTVYLAGRSTLLIATAVPFVAPFRHFDQVRVVEALEASDLTGHVHHALLSPDGSKLYAGIDDGLEGDRADIVQLDLTDGDHRTVLGRALGTHSPSFQLGPDGKIYVGSFQAADADDVLGIIAAPNAAGAAAELDPAGLPLAPGCDVRRGLVNFAQGGMRLLDTDRDGLIEMADDDNDGDGLLDTVEGGADWLELDVDPDSNGVLAWNEPSAPTCAVAGILECTALTATIDPDADQLPSPDDLDSDGDGIPDLWECGGVVFDANHDGRLDAVNPVQCADTDQDQMPNWLDLDSDNDGFSDRAEASGAVGADADQDGWADDEHEGVVVGLARDLDSDGVPDWLDPTDDRPVDAGVPDAAPDADVPDAALPEAGAPDASTDSGASTEADAEAPGLEAGSRVDAGKGGASDAGDATDPKSDGAIPDLGGGCACDATGAPVDPGALLLVLGVALGRRRRRRAR